MDKIEEVLSRGVEQVYPTREALEKVLRSGQKIRLYQGFDPSMPNLHLGNLVGLTKLRQFQDLGHEVIFLIGDFTGMIGDPTDKSATRSRLTREEVLKNSERWQEQAGNVLDFTGPNAAKVKFNSEWNDKLTYKELIEITSNFTVQQLLERDFFQKRLQNEQPIYLHEFLYPVAQALDSVKMDVDLEIGGNDQTFNMLAGRMLVKALNHKEKYVLTTKLLVDAQGNKVGKTTGNALFLNLPPEEMFGAVMSFPDEVITLGFELLTSVPMEEIKSMEMSLQTNQINPMDLKKKLAEEIITIFYGAKPSEEAKTEFERVFQKKETPNDIETYEVGPHRLLDILFEIGFIPSKTEGKRLIAQEAIEVDGKIVTDPEYVLENSAVVKKGKKSYVKLNVDINIKQS